MTPVLEFQSVCKTFAERSILKDISLSVEGGEFLTFLGPSGSGKTTLLRLVGGFEQLDGGKILLNGEDISRLPPYKRRVNTVFQSYALFPHLSVFRNITFGLQNLGIERNEMRERVASVLQMVQLRGLEERFPRELSGGQQQRVALARAMVMRPAVLLLDEPFGALDQQLRKEMQAELKALQRKLGLTFVFVTHDQEEALSLSDRVVLLHQGQLEQVGRPEEIYSRPKTRFAAEFMGVENVFGISEIKVNGALVVCRLESGAEFQVEKSNDLNDHGSFLAIRSSEVLISRSAPDPGRFNAIRGRIRSRNYLGDVVLWTVDDGSGERWLVSQSTSSRQTESGQFSVGEHVFLGWNTQSGVLIS
jgi:spermidine/putrescine transport system ATP-binding protein